MDDFLVLDMSLIARQIDLELSATYMWSWTRAGDSNVPQAQLNVDVLPGQGFCLSYNYSGESIGPYMVPVVFTTPNFGGRRCWALCPNPKCRKRVRILYLNKYFLCRHCHNLTYETAQTGGKLLPAIKGRLNYLRRTLGTAGGQPFQLPAKPPCMHVRTYTRLTREYRDLTYLREQLLTCELFELFKIFDLGGDLPPVPNSISEELRNKWKALKAQRE